MLPGLGQQAVRVDEAIVHQRRPHLTRQSIMVVTEIASRVVGRVDADHVDGLIVQRRQSVEGIRADRSTAGTGKTGIHRLIHNQSTGSVHRCGQQRIRPPTIRDRNPATPRPLKPHEHLSTTHHRESATDPAE